MQYADRIKQEESRLIRIAQEEQLRREQRDLEMQVLSVIKKVTFHPWGIVYKRKCKCLY